MKQCPGDPTHFLNTHSSSGNHIPCITTISSDVSFAAVGCRDGGCFVYRLPLREVVAAFYLPLRENAIHLQFTPCSHFLFGFQQLQIGELEPVLNVYRFDLSQVFEKYESDGIVLGEAPIVWEDSIWHVQLKHVYFTEFRYQDGLYQGTEFVIHTEQGILTARQVDKQKLRVEDLLQHVSPHIPPDDPSTVILNITVALGRLYIIHLATKLLVFVRSYHDEFKLTLAGSCDLPTADEDQSRNITLQQTLEAMQSYYILELSNEHIMIYSSYSDFRDKKPFSESLPGSFIVLQNQKLIVIGMEIESNTVDNEADVTEDLRSEPSANMLETQETAIPETNNDETIWSLANSEICGFMGQDFAMQIYPLTEVDIEALSSIQIIVRFGDQIIVSAQNAFAQINLESITPFYELRNFRIPCTHSFFLIHREEFYATYCFSGQATESLRLRSLPIQRREEFYLPEDKSVHYQPQLRHSPALISLPVHFEEFGAFVNGFKPVDRYVLYIEREDEYDIEPDGVMYPAGSRQRSIETIEEQVRGLCGWVEEEVSDVDLGDYE